MTYAFLRTLIERDPMLAPYIADLRRRAPRIETTRSQLTDAEARVLNEHSING